jgi:hypothetical protein
VSALMTTVHLLTQRKVAYALLPWRPPRRLPGRPPSVVQTRVLERLLPVAQRPEQARLLRVEQNPEAARPLEE